MVQQNKSPGAWEMLVEVIKRQTSQNNKKNMEKMILNIQDDFKLEKIAGSGQCFRWERGGGGEYRIIAGNACAYITALDSEVCLLECEGPEVEKFWKNYFDMQTSYRQIRERIDWDQDPFLWQASEAEKGIRILQQDPWEMLITFIISQNRNIPAIRKSVELLSEICGEKMTDSRGRLYYAFPKPEALAGLSDESLKECKLGYRCKYVKAAAVTAAEGDIDLKALADAGEEDTVKALTRLYGVGAKVASCISLFGLHHLNAFPIDVWIKRLLEQEYPQGYPYERYAPYNGVYQQYMFEYYRKKNK